MVSSWRQGASPLRHSRIYTSQALFSAGSIELEGPASHYLSRVLRLAVGDSVILFNGDGSDYRGEICGIQRQSVSVKLFDSFIPGNESPLKITLVQAISRQERMDYSLQKCTELGVSCIQPVISRRVEFRLDTTRLAKRVAHWQRVVISACEQCGRAVVPKVMMPVPLAEWMAGIDESPRLILDPAGEIKMSSFSMPGDAVSVLVGPEGGFTGEELEQARLNDFRTVSLGPRVLRTESAGPAMIAVLQAVAGDG